MRIRSARGGDVPELAQLWLEFGTYYADLDPKQFKAPSSDGLEKWVEERLAQSRERWLVAEVGGEIAGFAVATVMDPHPHAEWKMLTDAEARRLGINVVHTAAGFRRQGVATALITELEAWGRSEDAEIVVAETDVHSPSAIPFWEKADGYERTSVRFRKRL
jgi:ribosomal protein S18 acetylase RimI-like enzyme